MEAPIIIKPVPDQIINELAGFMPFRLAEYVAAADSSICRYKAELSSGDPLPKGMICTSDGILTGIPAKGTQGTYPIVLTVENEAGHVNVEFKLIIKETLRTDDDYITDLKAKVWDALQQQLPIPDLSELYDRPISIQDVYYLLERWGILTIWDAFNLDPPGDKVLLKLEGISKHYQIFDRGSCLVACPKDLFSHERTLEDGIQTVKVMAKVAYDRHWTLELAGFDKLSRAAWLEIQRLGDVHGKRAEVINYTPRLADIELYNIQAKQLKSGGGMD